jgi:ribosomal protein S18 acetylase RimI-like enzyme
MYKPKWTQYTWDLAQIPEDTISGDVRGDLRLAEKSDQEQCEEVMKRAIITERAWSSFGDGRIADFFALVPFCFANEPTAEVVVWEDGRRIVGLSGLFLDPDAPRQLVTGVCVFEEYRCRGGGEALLLRSLHRLKKHGMKSASVVTRDNLTAARFLYPKFGSQITVLDELPAWDSVAAG